MKCPKHIKIALFSAFSIGTLTAQENVEQTESEEATENTTYKAFDFNLQVKNMHLWRAFRVTDAPMTGAHVSYVSRNGKFGAGFWGGAGFTGEYTEIDYYVSYSTNGFTLSLWDINNYSDYPDAGIFDYDRSTTSHFVDLTLAYAFREIPLKASWSTILLGRDTYVSDGGKLENAFSNYIELSHTLLKNERSSLEVYIAGAFSFENNTSFYGDKAINNFGLVYGKDVKVFKDVYLPTSAKVMWNPGARFASLQVALNFF